jgi:hypothetical protein
LKDGTDGVNGVYIYGAGGLFPNQSFQSANYWADVVFLPTGGFGTPQTVAAFSGTPQVATVGTTFTSVLEAKVTDAGATPLADIPVTFSVPAGGASATFAGANLITVNTNASGIASAPAPTANTTAGSYGVTASVTGIATSAVFNLTNVAGSPQSVVAFSGTPQSATGGTLFGSALQAKVIDAYSNPVPGVSVTFYSSGKRV